ncbi:MAG: DUF6270 domain-containing protein [Roseovarius sp.]|nr:DUF6270 domain-containing protein [Roseovarius sp.]
MSSCSFVGEAWAKLLIHRRSDTLRDAFELAEHQHVISGFSARSSFACSFLDAPFALSSQELDPAGLISSPWQRRMLNADISRSLPRQIADTATEIDAFLIDFIDERFGLAVYKGTLATYSVAFLTCAKDIPDEIIRSGSDAHFEAWKKGFASFLELSKSLKKPVIINKVFWAGRSDTMEHFGDKFINRGNSYLRRLYQFAESEGCLVLDYEGHEFTIDAGHKWGVGPFHYKPETYQKTLDILGEVEAGLVGQESLHR